MSFLLELVSELCVSVMEKGSNHLFVVCGNHINFLLVSVITVFVVFFGFKWTPNQHLKNKDSFQRQLSFLTFLHFGSSISR